MTRQQLQPGEVRSPDLAGHSAHLARLGGWIGVDQKVHPEAPGASNGRPSPSIRHTGGSSGSHEHGIPRDFNHTGKVPHGRGSDVGLGLI